METNKRRVRGRRFATALAAIVGLAALLAGCSSATNEGASPKPGGGAAASPAAATAPAATVAPKPAELKPVQLVWYLRQAKPQNDQAVIQKFNEMVKAKINATVEFKFLNPGDYDDKMKLVMSSGEAYDLAFTASWSNNFANNVSKGAYLPLDAYIEQYPAIKNMYTPQIWEALKTNGKTYGIPNLQIMATGQGIAFQSEIVKQHGIDLGKVKSLEDLTPILQKVKDNNPGVYPVRNGNIALTTFNKYYPSVAGFMIDPATMTVMADYDSQMKPRYDLMREWNQKGFFPPDVATLKNEDELLKAGKIFAMFRRSKPGTEAEWKAKYGRDFMQLDTGTPTINQAAVLSTVTAVSQTSKNPDRAVMLYNLLLTDKDIYNVLVNGIEGQDYTKLSANRIEPKKDGYTILNWEIASVFNSYLIPGQADDVWEQTRKLNDSSIIDPLVSFNFNPTPVQSELAQINAANSEFNPILLNGMADVATTLKQKTDKMKTAGVDKVIAEINKQLADWKAKK
ncbi:MAG: ABC transporter substrate-binding protein [Paenibacillaceae bacterium]|nr:ABC transporter substrate-binding protein [Paenibacillaceae bacterium]